MSGDAQSGYEASLCDKLDTALEYDFVCWRNWFMSSWRVFFEIFLLNVGIWFVWDLSHWNICAGFVSVAKFLMVCIAVVHQSVSQSLIIKNVCLLWMHVCSSRDLNLISKICASIVIKSCEPERIMLAFTIWALAQAQAQAHRHFNKSVYVVCSSCLSFTLSSRVKLWKCRFIWKRFINFYIHVDEIAGILTLMNFVW